MQWRGYFSSRLWLYKKINYRVSYNRLVWENRLIGASVNELHGQSYVYRLQSRKNNLSGVSLYSQSTGYRHIIITTKSLKRKHYSYKALGAALVKQNDSI